MPDAAIAAAAVSQAINAVKCLSIIATISEVNIIEQYNHPCSSAKTPSAKRLPFSVIKAKTLSLYGCASVPYPTEPKTRLIMSAVNAPIPGINPAITAGACRFGTA